MKKSKMTVGGITYDVFTKEADKPYRLAKDGTEITMEEWEELYKAKHVDITIQAFPLLNLHKHDSGYSDEDMKLEIKKDELLRKVKL